MKKIIVDTWGWIVLYNKREPKHTVVSRFYHRLREGGAIFYTTDYIFDETLTLLFRRLPFPLAKKTMEYLDKAVGQGYLKQEWITPQRVKRAKDLRLRFQDKPDISFTDLTTMAVMQELGLSDILTEDEHFFKVGLGFKTVP
jgi:predicted nucleic acid-binding protein